MSANSSLNGNKTDQTLVDLVNNEKSSPTQDNDGWYDVGFYRSNSCIVSSYCMNSNRVSLEPGTVYKLRVAAVNSCGRSKWSEPTAFSTCLPGYPTAPSNVRISRTSSGATLFWEPSLHTGTSEEDLEYAVYLAVGKTALKTQSTIKIISTTASQLAFELVYSGSENSCTIPTSSLSNAYIDIVKKPAIIFRIAARNKKGYGPSVQVRWIQDEAQSSNIQV